MFNPYVALKKVFKWLIISFLIFVVVLAVVVASKQNTKYDAPYPKITISTDSAVLARGEYLVYGPGHCADCHGKVDMIDAKERGDIVPLEGGFTFILPVGKVHTPNITPDVETGIGKYKTEELARALRYGVKPNGSVLIDFMPFHNTSDEDLSAIFSYLKTMQPVKHKVPEHEWNMLGYIVKAFAIKPVGPDGEVVKSIQPDTTIAYGKYLANSVANCRGCHTNRDLKTGAFIGPDFAGGFQMESPLDPANYACVTPNITPDPETGRMIGWTEETFITRFRSGKAIKHSAMPWGPFKRMSDNDLKAIFRYLQTIKPVKNKIDKTFIELKNA